MMRKASIFILMIFSSMTVYGQEETSELDEQSRESMAMDATATQWSYQVAYQLMPDYYNDEVNGSPRRAGLITTCKFV